MSKLTKYYRQLNYRPSHYVLWGITALVLLITLFWTIILPYLERLEERSSKISSEDLTVSSSLFQQAGLSDFSSSSEPRRPIPTGMMISEAELYGTNSRTLSSVKTTLLPLSSETSEEVHPTPAVTPRALSSPDTPPLSLAGTDSVESFDDSTSTPRTKITLKPVLRVQVPSSPPAVPIHVQLPPLEKAEPLPPVPLVPDAPSSEGQSQENLLRDTATLLEGLSEQHQKILDQWEALGITP